MASQDYIKELSQHLLDSRVSLESVGSLGSAWRKQDALRVLAAIRESDWAVLGGDVIDISSDTFRFTYDNWACEPQTTETIEAFKSRSLAKAEEYIFNYPEQGERDYCYLIVCGRPL